MESKNYESMTVKELREESRKRGLTLEKNGKKFTKSELIERINKYDMEKQDDVNDINKAIEEAGQPVNSADDEVWTSKDETCCELNVPENKGEDYIPFAKTIDEMEKRYGNRKSQRIYDEELKVGCFIVYVRHIEASNGNFYKKLGTAKVVGVNRAKERVRVETPVGETKELAYCELLYIRSIEERRYPKDISEMLYKQRQEYKSRKESLSV